VKSIPYACRTNRRVLGSLKLMRELDNMAREGDVSGMLAKVSEDYGVELPVRLRTGSS